MHKLKFADASFLYAETANAPMNIASLQLLKVPDRLRSGFFDKLTKHLAEHVGRIDFMTRKLVDAPFGLDQPIWVTDKHFDLKQHVLRTALPPPGTFHQLERLISQLHERPLDRRAPLWQFHLIEGLEDGRFALYTKYHHACIDGMAGQQVIEALYADTPNGKPKLRLPVREPEPTPPLGTQWFDAMINATAQPILNLTRMAQTMRVSQAVAETLRDPARAGAYAQSVPPTPFNVTVSQYRNVAFGTLPLQSLRKLAKESRASINDVFLCVCAGGLRLYLDRKDQLPEAPLIASVPVSLRRPGDTGMDNRVSMLLSSLASDIDEPLARLDAIRQSSMAGKRLIAQTAQLPVMDVHMPGMPIVAASLAQFAETMRVAESSRPVANIVISNVPGPRVQKYLCGAEMTTHYPVSIPSNGMALNITVQSYMDRMDFSITACLEAVPDAGVLRDDMLSAWQELLHAATPSESQVAA